MISDMQIETTVRDHFILIRTDDTKQTRPVHNKCWEEYELGGEGREGEGEEKKIMMMMVMMVMMVMMMINELRQGFSV